MCLPFLEHSSNLHQRYFCAVMRHRPRRLCVPICEKRYRPYPRTPSRQGGFGIASHFSTVSWSISTRPLRMSCCAASRESPSIPAINPSSLGLDTVNVSSSYRCGSAASSCPRCTASLHLSRSPHLCRCGAARFAQTPRFFHKKRQRHYTGHMGQYRLSQTAQCRAMSSCPNSRDATFPDNRCPVLKAP